MKLIIAATLIASTSAMSSGYLNNLASNSATVGGGIGGYLDVLGGGAAPTTGAGLSGYLDTMGGAPAAPVAAPQVVAAPVAAAPVAAAPVAAAPAAVSASAAAAGVPAAAGDYLTNLAGAISISGGGLTTHLDTLASNSAPTGSGLSGYLSALPVAAAVSGAGLSTYTDILLSNSALEGSGAAPVAAGIAAAAAVSGPTTGSGAFLQSVFGQIQALNADEVSSQGGSLVSNGDSVAFAIGKDNIAMTFVKN